MRAYVIGTGDTKRAELVYVRDLQVVVPSRFSNRCRRR